MMSVQESLHLNTVLRWLLQIPASKYDPPPGDKAAMESACILARQAHKKLGAGLNEHHVVEHWERRRR